MWGWYIAAGVVGLLAFRWVHRVNPKDIKDLLAFPIQIGAFIFLILFFAFGAPQIVMRTPNLLRRGWERPVSMFAEPVNQARDSISRSLNDPALDSGYSYEYGDGSHGEVQFPLDDQSGGGVIIPPPIEGAYVPTARHVVQNGETLFGLAQKYDVTVTELRSWNNLRPDDILPVGMELIVAAEAEAGPTATPSPTVVVSAEAVTDPEGTPEASPTPPPTPTPTATVDLRPYYRDLGALRDGENSPDCQAICRRAEALRIVTQILGVFPDDDLSRQVRQELYEAGLIHDGFEAVGDKGVDGNYVFTQERHDEVAELLAGFEYEVLEVERTLCCSTKWNQTAVIRVVSGGWLFGEEIELSVGHINRLGGNSVGDRFFVYGP